VTGIVQSLDGPGIVYVATLRSLETLHDALADAGVAVRAVSPTYAGGKGCPGLILGFGGFSPQQMETAARDLAAVIVSAARARLNPAAGSSR
jgi:GntR family transcriptional regulator/MocR family aminotransferase